MVTEFCALNYSIILFALAAFYTLVIVATILIFLSNVCKQKRKCLFLKRVFRKKTIGDYKMIKKKRSKEDMTNSAESSIAVHHLMTNYYFYDETFHRNSYFITNDASNCSSLDLIRDNLFINYNIETASTKL